MSKYILLLESTDGKRYWQKHDSQEEAVKAFIWHSNIGAKFFGVIPVAEQTTYGVVAQKTIEQKQDQDIVLESAQR